MYTFTIDSVDPCGSRTTRTPAKDISSSLALPPVVMNRDHVHVVETSIRLDETVV